jgi:hypothetical protein
MRGEQQPAVPEGSDGESELRGGAHAAGLGGAPSPREASGEIPAPPSETARDEDPDASQPRAAVRGGGLLRRLRWPLIDGGALARRVWRCGELAAYWDKVRDYVEEAMAVQLASAAVGGRASPGSSESSPVRLGGGVGADAGAAPPGLLEVAPAGWDPVAVARCRCLGPDHFRRRAAAAAPGTERPARGPS